LGFNVLHFEGWRSQQTPREPKGTGVWTDRADHDEYGDADKQMTEYSPSNFHVGFFRHIQPKRIDNARRKVVYTFIFGDYDDLKSPTIITEERDGIYDEAEVCRAWRLDDLARIDAHLQRYQQMGYPAHNGLYTTRIIARWLRDSGERDLSTPDSPFNENCAQPNRLQELVRRRINERALLLRHLSNLPALWSVFEFRRER
jgi:hypothetical protein